MMGDAMKFYTLGPDGVESDWYVEPPRSCKLTDEYLWDLLCGASEPKGQIRFIRKGRKKVDLIYGKSQIWFPQRAIELMTTCNFTGWRHYPVQITPSPGEKYYGVSFLGRAGLRIGARTDSGPEKFSLAKWDGKDFFMLEDSGCQFITDRVVNAFKKAAFTGVVYEPAKPI